MKRFILAICGSLSLLTGTVQSHAMAGDLNHPSLALPADTPPELHRRVIGILSAPAANFLRGRFLNAHTTLEYSGSTAALNQMLASLAECGGIRVKMKLIRDAGGAAWTLHHNGLASAREIFMDINLVAPSIKVEDLDIPAFGKVAPEKPDSPGAASVEIGKGRQ